MIMSNKSSGATILFIIGLFLGTALGYYYTQTQNLGQPSFTGSEIIPEGSTSLYLCPQDECAEQLITFINSAKSSVHVMIYSLTHDEITSALIQAKNRGLDVKVIIDNLQAGGESSDDETLLAAGVEVKIINLPGRNIFHNKITIVDGQRFSTGSFNYSENADSGSAENLVIISSQKMSQRLEQEFQYYWNQ